MIAILINFDALVDYFLVAAIVVVLLIHRGIFPDVIFLIYRVFGNQFSLATFLETFAHHSLLRVEMKNGTSTSSFAQIFHIVLASLRWLNRSGSAALVIELAVHTRFGLLDLDGHDAHHRDLPSFI